MNTMVTELYPYAIKLAQTYARTGLELEDLLQEECIAILRVERVYDGKDRESLVRLAKTGARNRARNLIRRTVQRGKYLGEMPEDVIERVGDRERAKEILDDLRNSNDSPLLSLMLDGRSIRECSDILRLSMRTLYRQVEVLRKVYSALA